MKICSHDKVASPLIEPPAVLFSSKSSPDASMFSRLKHSLSPTKKPINADNNSSRKRNRLSKPPTKRSSQNLSSLSILQPGNRSSSLFPLSTSTEDLRHQSQLGRNDEREESVKPRSLSSEPECSQAPRHAETNSWREGASAVGDAETQLSSSPSTRSAVSSPLTAILNPSRFSLISSKEYQDPKEARPPKAGICSRNASQEDLTAPVAIRRKSLHQPGIATRSSKDGNWGPSSPGETGVAPEHNDSYNSVILEEASRNELEALSSEMTKAQKPVPPPLVRTETPSDLVFLGGLKLGSLHVTNGRVSPVPSDLSRRVQTRSTPNLRLSSSDYGDSDQEDHDTDLRAVFQNATSRRPSMPEVVLRSGLQDRHYQRISLLPSNDNVSKINTTLLDAYQSSPVRKPLREIATNERSLDISVSIAEEYKAELPATPFGPVHPSKISQSPLESTSKSSALDDNLFENESVTPSESDIADNSTVDTLYSVNDVTADQGKQESSTQKAKTPFTSGDSGYSSNTLLRAAQKEVYKEAVTEGTKSINTSSAATSNSETEPRMPEQGQEPRPGLRPLRSSILKEAGATTTSLPIFENLQHSSTTISTVLTTASMPPRQKSKKLTKANLVPRSARSKEVTISGNHDIFNGSIPPVPAEFVANLAIRSRQVPELEHTFEPRQHTAESPTKSHVELVEIRFPSPTPNLEGPDHESAPARPPGHTEATLRRGSKSDSRSSVHRSSNDMSESDARAVIQDFGTVGHSLGGNPYDIARGNLHSNHRRNVDPPLKTNPHNITSWANRPKPTDGMDAETASHVARIRSQSIRERDRMSLAEKRNLFNDRGGVPGKNLRPTSSAANTPPLPPLPAGFQIYQRQSRARQTFCPSLRQVGSCRPEHDEPTSEKDRIMQSVNDQARLGLPKALNPDGGLENEISPGNYRSDHQQADDDRRQSWRSDRVEIDFDPSLDPALRYEQSNFADKYMDNAHFENYGSWRRRQAASQSCLQLNLNEPQKDAPLPPPSHPPKPLPITASETEGHNCVPNTKGWQGRKPSAGEFLRSTSDSRSHQDDSLCPHDPHRGMPSTPTYNYYATPPNSYHQYPRNIRSSTKASYCSRQSRSDRNPLETTQNEANNYHGVNAVPLVHCVQPRHDRLRIRPKPRFGRYSDGFSSGCEHGSVFYGTGDIRSVSGVADASRRGKELSQGFGIDFGDVPVITGVKAF